MMSPASDAICNLWSALAGEAGDNALFLSDCFFHTVEALVVVEQTEGIDPMALFVLRALEFAQPADAEHVDEVLHLGRQVTRQLLEGLVENGLLTESAAAFRLTDQGRSTLHAGQLIRRVLRRRLFHFVHPGMQYVAVHDPKGNLLGDLSPNRAPAPWEFDPAVLREVVARPMEWKRRHRFPQDVLDVVTTPVPAGPPDDDTTASGAVKKEPPETLQHLVVDKAQLVTCALVARAWGAGVEGLVAYPVSAHGSLLPGKSQPLFSLDDADDIRKICPTLWTEPDAEQVTQSWLTLAAQKLLPEPERADVRFDGRRLVIVLTEALAGRWNDFVVLALQGELRWHVPCGDLLRLCPIAVEGADAQVSAQLQVLRSILTLELDPELADILRDSTRLENWLSAQGLAVCPSLRGLADLAFRFGRYRVAYQIAELEDMSDAPV